MAVTPRDIIEKMPRPILALLQRVVGNRELLDAEKVVRSIPERWLDPALREHVVAMRVIRPAGAESYLFPDPFPPAFRREMHFARRHVYHLSNVSVNALTGSCAAGSLYFQESYGSLRRCLLEHPFPVSKGRPLGDGVVTCVNSASYYHFLLEEVPRLLWALHCHKGLAVLVHRSAPGYVRQVLGKICDSDQVAVTDDGAVQVPNYVFTQAEAYSGFVNKADLVLLREHLLAPRSREALPRKVYITRQKASRSFDNEEEIVAFMLESGFEVCLLEELDVEAQIELFRNATVVVAPHGAGLANLLWCDPGTRVLELFSVRYFNDCYARICSHLGLDYTPLWARETPGWGQVPLEQLAAFLAGREVASGFPENEQDQANCPCP